MLREDQVWGLATPVGTLTLVVEVVPKVYLYSLCWLVGMAEAEMPHQALTQRRTLRSGTVNPPNHTPALTFLSGGFLASAIALRRRLAPELGIEVSVFI